VSAFLLPPRLEGVIEWMDLPGASDEELRGTLRDLERLNRHFGGVRAVLLHLRRMAAPRGEGPVRILDIATGGGDIPRAIVRWARRRGLPVQVEAVDRNPQAVDAAAAWCAGYPEIRVRLAEVPPLPYPDRCFDYAVASLFLHHLSAEHCVGLLREMVRVARHGLIVSDLRRSRPARLVTALATRLMSRNRLTRHDGPISILRGFTAAELRRMAAAAGLAGGRTARHAWFRIVLAAELSPAGARRRP
jgi:2-polyprenyl-3-methyl-5-hydroxy-6-metoxy-1,4-benzoquinol methylase